MLSVSADYTKISKKSPEKKHTEHERDVKNGIFERETVVYIRIFHSIFGFFRVFLSV